jgi:hypothetical protein
MKAEGVGSCDFISKSHKKNRIKSFIIFLESDEGAGRRSRTIDHISGSPKQNRIMRSYFEIQKREQVK